MAKREKKFEFQTPLPRRNFLRWAGLAGLASLCPAWPVFAQSAFDLALEGQNLLASQKYGEAIAALQKATELDPESDWCWGLLGRAYFQNGDAARAVDAFRRATRINPADNYSRMMIEIITQRPVARVKKPPKPLTQLEKQALEEERRMQASLAADEGLDYRVKRVVIDPGHGGFDPGAVGPGGLKEKDVVLDIGKRLYNRLKSQGKYTPFLTRTGDYYVPLGERTATANQYRADLFISLHINANANSKAHGSETYYCSGKASNQEAARVAAFENSVLKFEDPVTRKPGQIDIEEILFSFEQKMNWEQSGSFAEVFQKRLESGLPFRSRGVNSANFFVLRRAKMPAILLETGFISNPENERELQKSATIDKIVDAVVRGLGG